MGIKQRGSAASPSFISKFIRWIENRKLPSIIFYILIWIVLNLIQLIPKYLESGKIFSETLPVHFWLSAMLPIFLNLIRYLDESAVKAVRNMKGVLSKNRIALDEIESAFQNLPGLPSFIFGFCVFLIIFIVEQIFGKYDLPSLTILPISNMIFRVVYLFCWFIFGIYIYHTIYLLNLIQKVFKNSVNVDIFQVKLLYSLSTVSALNAGSIALVVYGWNLVNPIVLSRDLISLIIMGIILVLALIAFIFPLLDIHSRLSLAKDIALNQCSLREGKLISKLNELVDKGDFTDLDGLRSGIDNLEIEYSIIKRISTWPWEPETFRFLFSALLLPMVIWFAQYVLELFVFNK